MKQMEIPIGRYIMETSESKCVKELLIIRTVGSTLMGAYPSGKTTQGKAILTMNPETLLYHLSPTAVGP